MTSNKSTAATQAAHQHGYYRITTASPRVEVACPSKNALATIEMARVCASSDLIVFPELGLTGYTCGDLFATTTLLDQAEDALAMVAEQTADMNSTLVVGLPVRMATSVMNAAVVIRQGQVIGVVPKTYLPTYREFYEGRHFRAAHHSDPATIRLNGQSVPFGTDLLFQDGAAVLGIEICEDLWVPVPPSSQAVIAGANVIANLSASNETIGKAQWRRDLVISQSGRLIAAYVYSSAGGGESTSDLVFGGHCLIAENGSLLGQSRRIGDGGDPIIPDSSQLTCDVDLQRLDHDRRVIGSFDDARGQVTQPYRFLNLRESAADSSDVSDKSVSIDLLRTIDAHPFVPDDSKMRQERCAEVLAIQTGGLVKRLSGLPVDMKLVIGISGGLDSTLALLVAVAAVDHLKRPRSVIHAMGMPGFGTTQHTRDNARDLVESLGVTFEEVDVRKLATQTFRELQHAPLGIELDDSTTIEELQEKLTETDDDAKDLVFENIQARLRTFLLMTRGFVLGTGDLSEQALGWSTYNGDHMSMYNVNASIPKTLVRYLVRYFADCRCDSDRFDKQLQPLLHAIADTPISPELLPPSQSGEIRQSTEASLGPYELHDFFLYHFVRGGCGEEKLRFLARNATFNEAHDDEVIDRTLDTFIRRFFASQYKRNCVPDGPKVGSVSLSPRGDWRMPSDANAKDFL